MRQNRQLLELKGDCKIFIRIEVQILYKNQKYSIITSIQFPLNYPDGAPIVRIHNPDINKFKPNAHFQAGA